MSWLDDVRLRERIGKGSFGRVYRADLQRPWGTDACAIKIVETESRAELCAALREVAFLRLAGAHPNIVTFIGLSAHAADRGGCSLHVFLELCVCSLADVVRSRKAPLSDLAVLACEHEIASALRFLHDELAAVHRDVK
jgi:serine/threonine protein kinase